MSAKTVDVMLPQSMSSNQHVVHVALTQLHVKCISTELGGREVALHDVESTGDLLATRGRLIIIAF